MFLRTYTFVVLACVLLASAATSCRVPTPPILNDPSVGYLYDPKTADAIAEKFPPSAEQRELNERYRTALAEPVSVVAWEPEQSQWQVFYATNRTRAVTTNGGAQFGTAWGSELSLGTCKVTLPKSERGTGADAAKFAVKLASWLPGFAKSSAEKQAAQVVVDEPRAMEAGFFLNSVRETVERSPEHDVLVFVHGFNVDFAGSVTRTAQIALDLPFNGAVIAYSWPSQGGVANYANDEKIVADSVTPFVFFLEELNRSLPPDTRIHLVVHSMGNRLVLRGLSRLPNYFRQPPRFENVVLAAPDLGILEFETIAQKAAAVAKRTTLYVHESDTALIASKALHSEQRIGDAVPPVVVPGIETIDASGIDTSFMGHSYYGSNRRALSDLFALVKENRGAGQRPWLRTESGNQGTWWVFTSQPAEIRCTWYFEALNGEKMEAQ